MVTSVTDIKVTKGGHDYEYHDYSGLSSDSKPTTGVFNGSTFLEMDTGKVFVFDATTLSWIEL